MQTIINTNNLVTYILVDYESVCDNDLSILNSLNNYYLYIFLGKNNISLSTTLVLHMHALQDKATYIKIDKSGKNALDFHLVYYLGTLVNFNCQNNKLKSRFYIIAKDKGYDILIETLNRQKIDIKRLENIKDIRSIKYKIMSFDEKIQHIILQLKTSNNKPSKLLSLHNFIKDKCKGDNNIDESQLNKLVQHLQKLGYIKIDEKSKNILYFNLNKEQIN